MPDGLPSTNDFSAYLFSRTLALCLAFSAVRIYAVNLSPVTYKMGQDDILASVGILFIVLGLFYMKIRPDRWLWETCLSFGIPLFCQVCACEFGNLAFYFGRSFPLQDEALAWIDKAMGFCWPCMLHCFNDHQTLNAFAKIFYGSIYLQPLVLTGIMLYRRDTTRICTYFVAYNIAYILTNIVAYRFPALGVYEFLHISPLDHPNITTRFANQMTVPITMLREGHLSRAFTEQQILISFPSFHAVLACLFTWCAWTSRARWPFVLTNVIMLVATPIQGGHYLIDIVAGLAIGLASIKISRNLVATWTSGYWRDRTVLQAAPSAL